MRHIVSITCAQAEDLMIRRMYESLRIPEAASLLAHTGACPQCRSYAATLQDMQRALAPELSAIPAPDPSILCLLQARLLALSPVASVSWLDRLAGLAWSFMKPAYGYQLAGATALALCLVFIANHAPIRMDPRQNVPAITADSMESIASPDSQPDSLHHLEEVRRTADDSILILMTGQSI